MPVTRPVAELAVATDVFVLLQTPPTVASASEVEAPTHSDNVPTIGLTGGSGFTDSVRVMDESPHIFATVYVMVAVPTAIPVTTPEEAFTLAIKVLLLLHVPPVMESVSVVDAPKHTCVLPKIAGITGTETTVSGIVTLAGHPYMFVTV